MKKKFFSEMPKGDGKLLFVALFMGIMLAVIIGGVGYFSGAPKAVYIGVSAVAGLMVPGMYLWELIYLYRVSERDGTPRYSTTDYTNPWYKPEPDTEAKMWHMAMRGKAEK